MHPLNNPWKCAAFWGCSVYISFMWLIWSHTPGWAATHWARIVQGLASVFLSACSWAKNILYFCDSRINELVLIAVEHGGSSCFWMPQTAIIQWQPKSGPGGKLNRSHLVLSMYCTVFWKGIVNTCSTVISLHHTLNIIISLHCMLHHPPIRRMAHIL